MDNDSSFSFNSCNSNNNCCSDPPPSLVSPYYHNETMIIFIHSFTHSPFNPLVDIISLSLISDISESFTLTVSSSVSYFLLTVFSWLVSSIFSFFNSDGVWVWRGVESVSSIPVLSSLILELVWLVLLLSLVGGSPEGIIPLFSLVISLWYASFLWRSALSDDCNCDIWFLKSATVTWSGDDWTDAVSDLLILIMISTLPPSLPLLPCTITISCLSH